MSIPHHQLIHDNALANRYVEGELAPRISGYDKSTPGYAVRVLFDLPEKLQRQCQVGDTAEFGVVTEKDSIRAKAIVFRWSWQDGTTAFVRMTEPTQVNTMLEAASRGNAGVPLAVVISSSASTRGCFDAAA